MSLTFTTYNDKYMQRYVRKSKRHLKTHWQATWQKNMFLQIADVLNLYGFFFAVFFFFLHVYELTRKPDIFRGTSRCYAVAFGVNRNVTPKPENLFKKKERHIKFPNICMTGRVQIENMHGFAEMDSANIYSAIWLVLMHNKRLETDILIQNRY